MSGKKALEGCCRCLEIGFFSACVTSCGLGFVKRRLSCLKYTEDLKKGEKVFTGTCRKSVKCMAYYVGMCVFVNEKANGQSFRCSAIVYIRNVRDTTADGEAGYD